MRAAVFGVLLLVPFWAPFAPAHAEETLCPPPTFTSGQFVTSDAPASWMRVRFSLPEKGTFATGAGMSIRRDAANYDPVILLVTLSNASFDFSDGIAGGLGSVEARAGDASVATSASECSSQNVTRTWKLSATTYTLFALSGSDSPQLLRMQIPASASVLSVEQGPTHFFTAGTLACSTNVHAGVIAASAEYSDGCVMRADAAHHLVSFVALDDALVAVFSPTSQAPYWTGPNGEHEVLPAAESRTRGPGNWTLHVDQRGPRVGILEHGLLGVWADIP